MRKLFLASIIALQPGFDGAAAQSTQQPKKPERSSTLRPIESNVCAQYGAGLVQVGGTTTCIKVGGGVTYEGGRRR